MIGLATLYDEAGLAFCIPQTHPHDPTPIAQPSADRRSRALDGGDRSRSDVERWDLRVTAACDVILQQNVARPTGCEEIDDLIAQRIASAALNSDTRAEAASMAYSRVPSVRRSSAR